MLHQSSLIADNQKEFIHHLSSGVDKFRKIFNHTKYTSSYAAYNVFGLTSTSLVMHALYKEITGLVRQELTPIIGDAPLWMQSWVNYQRAHEVLDWHDHIFPWHGYVCIDPKNTKTVFENWEINNVVGQIYFGQGYHKHKVEVIDRYDGYRITIGFDIATEPNIETVTLGLMPI